MTSTTSRKWLPKAGHYANFIPRARMKKVARGRARAIPQTSLPVDSTGNRSVSCPMDGNDQYGDCGEAMIAHADNILTYGQGKPGFTQSVFDETALVNQYKKISGGDNGMDESMVVGPEGAWTVGIAGNTAAKCDDSLDIGNDLASRLYCIDQFYTVEMAWSVPDDFVQNWTSGSSWLTAATPNPDLGHYTAVSDADKDGNNTIWTWGGWALASDAFIQSVQPDFFAAFSRRQFNAQGYDSKGRHVMDQAKKWVAIGGNTARAAAVVAMFPSPSPNPTPVPPAPIPPDPTPSPAPAVVWPASITATLADGTARLYLPSAATVISVDEITMLDKAGIDVVTLLASLGAKSKH